MLKLREPQDSSSSAFTQTATAESRPRGWTWTCALVVLSCGACSDIVAENDAEASDGQFDTGTSDADTAAYNDAVQDFGDGFDIDAPVADGGIECGNGLCDAEETTVTCPVDCSFLLRRFDGPCSASSSQPVCAAGFVCVPRSEKGGGDVCVADFATWPPIPDAHPASDFAESGESVMDQRTGLIWAKSALPAMTAAVALTACTTQTFEGEDDWRLPTYAELDSLADRSRQKPACGAPHLSWADNAVTNPYWTATPNPLTTKALQEKYTYQIAFADGSGGSAGMDWPAGVPFLRPVRCVRTPVSSAPPTGTGTRFAKSPDALTVLDRLSGLRWQWYYSVDKLAWTDAISWCAHNTAGMPGKGWRLPTVGELTQLLTHESEAPLIDPVFGAVAEGFWSATPSVQSDHAWAVLMQLGTGGTNWQVKPLRVRCVRN